MKLHQKVGKVLDESSTKSQIKIIQLYQKIWKSSSTCCALLSVNIKLSVFSPAHDVKIHHYKHHMYTVPKQNILL